MAYVPVTNINFQYDKNLNDYLKFYIPNTTTPFAMATDDTGATTLDKAQIDNTGFPTTDGTTLFIPFVSQSYDAWLFPTAADADANDTSNALRVAQNIDPFGPDLSRKMTTESISVIAGQLVINITATPISLALIINGATQQQTTDLGQPKAYTYDSVTGTITLTEALKGDEEVFVMYGAIVSYTRRDVEGALYFNTALSAVSDLDLAEGDSVITGGYTFFKDGGASNYVVRTTLQHGGTPDNKKDLLLDNGLVLASTEAVVNIVQMGAVSENISFDNSEIIVACGQANPDGVARVPIGRFYWDTAILYPDDFRGIIGDSKQDSVLHWIKTDEGDYGFRALNPTTCKLYRLENFTVRGAGFDEGQLLCKIDRIQYGCIKNVIFNDALILCDLNDFAFALQVENCRFGGLDGLTPVTGSVGLVLRQNPNGVNFERCDFYRMDLAVNALQAFSTNFTGGCVFENCNRAFNFSNVQKLVISDCYFEKIHDTHFTFVGGALTPKVIVEDNYFILNGVAESNAILKVDAGATNAKQIVFSGNNFRAQNAGAITSGYIVDITGAGAPLFVWWWNNDIYSSDLLTPLPEAHNMDSPRFIGDVPSYKVSLSTDWSTYEDGALANAGPLRVYMDDQTRKPFIRQDVKYVGASGTNTLFTLVTLPASFGITGATAGVPIMTQDISDFSIGKARITNTSDIQIGRGTIADLSNQTFQLDIQWPTEFNRTDPENR